jgi:uncharacterized membrane protein
MMNIFLTLLGMALILGTAAVAAFTESKEGRMVSAGLLVIIAFAAWGSSSKHQTALDQCTTAIQSK